jgi:hypothetical protein
MSSLNDQNKCTQVVTFSESIEAAKLKAMGMDAISEAVHAMNSKPSIEKYLTTNVEKHEYMILLKETALDAVHKTTLAYTAIQNVVHRVSALYRDHAARSKLDCEAKNMLKSWNIVLSKVQHIAKVVSYAESDYEKARKIDMPSSVPDWDIWLGWTEFGKTMSRIKGRCISLDNSIETLRYEVEDMYRTWDKFWKTLGCEDPLREEFPCCCGNMPYFMSDLLPDDENI